MMEERKVQGFPLCCLVISLSINSQKYIETNDQQTRTHTELKYMSYSLTVLIKIHLPVIKYMCI